MDQSSPAAVQVYKPPINKDIFWLLFSINGRISRSPYNMVYFPIIIVIISILFGNISLGSLAETKFILLLTIPILWVWTAITAKRMHDLDLRYWNILKAFIPIVGFFFLKHYLSILVWKKGDHAPNRFGECTRIVF